jgi:sulfur-oxidizing protein SoxX
MNSKMKQLLTAMAISSSLIAAPVAVQADGHGGAKAVEEGKKLAFSRSKGNCLACHAIQGGNQAGNIGPALIAMKLRFPDKQKLYNKLWGTEDSKKVPHSMMPEFGRNGILTDSEIAKITDYIYTL